MLNILLDKFLDGLLRERGNPDKINEGFCVVRVLAACCGS